MKHLLQRRNELIYLLGRRAICDEIYKELDKIEKRIKLLKEQGK